MLKGSWSWQTVGSLSELAVLGFEYGVSWESPNILPIWEAQFGDFFNGAQIIIDTYVSSGETKWLKQSGLVMLLPHGLDGAGPEHSSSRIERMLQLSNDSYQPTTDGKPANINMHVAYPTTPAQYFHLLRRQIKRNFRKPLIVAGPKALLRLAAASSSLSELEPGSKFKPVLEDPLIKDKSRVQRVVFLSGKLYYDLVKERQARSLDDDVALIRIEELSPFPFHHLEESLLPLRSAEEFMWVQEEPRNQGAWNHVKERIGTVLSIIGVAQGERALEYRGRNESAVPAPGIGKLYAAQQKKVVDSVFEGL